VVRSSLDELAVRHGTDKSSRRHGFAEIYETYVRPLRDEPIAMLEIGVWKGASLRMWADYFPNGRIHGLDHRPEAAEHAGSTRATSST
jgi:hypothetical protein